MTQNLIIRPQDLMNASQSKANFVYLNQQNIQREHGSSTQMMNYDAYNSQKLNEEYIERKLGIIPSIYNALKNVSGIGIGSNKAKNKLSEYREGKISLEDTEKYLKKYKANQKDSTELTTSTITGLASFGIYSNIKKIQIIAEAAIPMREFKAPKKIALISAILVGTITKPILKKINSLGVDKESHKKEKTTVRDFVTGAIGGMLAPIIPLGNLIIGIPAALGANSLTTYILAKTNKKSPDEYIEQQGTGLGLKTAALATFLFGAIKGHKSLKSWKDASLRASENVKQLEPTNIKLKISDLQDLTMHLAEKMKYKLFFILANPITSISSKMKQLEKYNLFLPKLLQVMPDNIIDLLQTQGSKTLKFPGVKNISKIIKGFKSDCPESRTIKDAQKLVTKTYGGKYKLAGDKAIGVGTIAESYLAKENSTGKDVVIKLLKKNVTPEKIEKDRQAILSLLDKCKIDDSAQLTFYKKQVEGLFDAWSKEIDLSLEEEMAKQLGVNAKLFNTVKPIETENNIYVMEKSSGIQFNKLLDYLEKSGRKLSKKEVVNLSINYLKVFLEQLLFVPKEGGKIIHADPHPGNIFINLDNLEKPITFIDTGNVLRYSPEEAITNVVNHLDYLIGNSQGIAKAMMKNALLPHNMNQEQAIQILTKELNDKIYNKKNRLPINLFQDINSFCLDVMHQNKIIPSPNNTNLLKAEMTYVLNLVSLKDITKYMIPNEKLDKKDMDFLRKQSILAIQEIFDSLKNSFKNRQDYTINELKSRIKFIRENKELFLSIIKSFYAQ